MTTQILAQLQWETETQAAKDAFKAGGAQDVAGYTIATCAAAAKFSRAMREMK